MEFLVQKRSNGFPRFFIKGTIMTVITKLGLTVTAGCENKRSSASGNFPGMENACKRLT